MSDYVTKRLQSELREFMASTPVGITAFPESTITEWTAHITGPPGSVFEKLSYKVSMHFDVHYPHKPPTIFFVTPCFHPNINRTGGICIDIFFDKWSPAYTVTTILLSLQCLLGEPNLEHGLNSQALTLYRQGNMKAYRNVVLEWYRGRLGI